MTSLPEYLEIRVTKIKHRWHARLINFRKGVVLDEMACALQQDIGWICGAMLRWHDKMGGTSPMAMAGRDRFNEGKPRPEGKVWGYQQLQEEKQALDST